jgi:hypothetical protein
MASTLSKRKKNFNTPRMYAKASQGERNINIYRSNEEIKQENFTKIRLRKKKSSEKEKRDFLTLLHK